MESNLAAWIQAIGSIISILVAIWVSSRQFHEATSLQRLAVHDERRRKFQALTALIQYAIKEFSEILEALRGEDPEKWFEEHSAAEFMEEFYDALVQMSPLEMPSPDSATALLKLRDRLKTAAWNANEAIQYTPSSKKEWDMCLDAMEDNLKDVREELKTLHRENLDLRSTGSSPIL